MKFLAILRDSLREAVDAKVFYVMLGLSALVIALGSSVTFRPQPGADMLMKMATIPLSIDFSNLDPTELRGDGDPLRMMQRIRGNFQVTEAVPTDGAPDLPDSTFRVVVRSSGGGFAGFGFLLGQGNPEKIKAQIRERFGVFDDMRLTEVLDVAHEKGNDYVVTARLTRQGRRLWPHDFSLFFGALPVISQGVPLGAQLYVLENVLVNQVGSWVTLLVSVVLTSFFIPNMLRKGTVDMLLVKPIHRVTLLGYKYVGGLLFIFINTAVAVTGVWIVLGLRSGIWAPGFLLSIPAITFYFAILYAVSTLFAVLTGSPIVCIIMTCMVWLGMFVVDVTKTIIDHFARERQATVRRNVVHLTGATLALSASPGPMGLVAVTGTGAAVDHFKPLEDQEGWFPPVVRAIHFVLPRTGDMNTLMDDQLKRDLMLLPKALSDQKLSVRGISWGESLTVSGAFIAVMLGMACWWFATKDY